MRHLADCAMYEVGENRLWEWVVSPLGLYYNIACVHTKGRLKCTGSGVSYNFFRFFTAGSWATIAGEI